MPQGSYKISDGTNTVAIPAAATAEDATLQTEPQVKSSSFTARNGAVFHVTATATVTDPTPAEGQGFDVLVINGTATVGGIAYSTAGTFIRRRYHSGAWQPNRVYLTSDQFATAAQGTLAGTALQPPVFTTDATGARTLALTDAWDYIRFTHATATVLTIPTHATVAIPLNTEIYFRRGASAGAITLSNAGVTVNGGANISLVGQSGNFALKKLANNEWDFI